MNEAVLRVLARLGLDAKPFKQEKVIELVKNPLSGAWVTVYSHHDAADGRPSVFACFADLARKQEILAGDDWLKHASSFSPGFCVCADDVTYHDGRDEGYDLLLPSSISIRSTKRRFWSTRNLSCCLNSTAAKTVATIASTSAAREKKSLTLLETRCVSGPNIYCASLQLSNASSSTLLTLGWHLRPTILWGALSAFQRVMKSEGTTISDSGTRAILMKLSAVHALPLEALSSPTTVETCGVWPFDEKMNGTPSSSTTNGLTARSFDTHVTRISLAPTLIRSIAPHIT